MAVKLTGWRHTGWRSCGDVNIPDVAEGVPHYFRCMRCYRLVTHGEVRFGGCVCGFRKLNPCLELTWGEILLLKLGWFPLPPWGVADIRPFFPSVCSRLRSRLLRPKLRRLANDGGPSLPELKHPYQP